MDLDLGFLTEMCVPVIMAACLVVGYCIKHIPALEKVSNAYIPTIMVVLGALLSIPVTMGAGGAVTLDSIVGGAVTGLASTGLHQVFKQIIETKTK